MNNKTLVILLIAGTSDARTIIERLAPEPVQLHATVTTDLGTEYLRQYPGLRIHQGRLDQAEMVQLIGAIKPDLMIDASHPFAKAASLNAMAACRESGTSYLRFEREATDSAGADLIWARDFDDAARKAAELTGNILLTIGSNHLEPFTRQIGDFRERLFIRVLPLQEVIAKCERFGFSAARIIGMKGPFSVEMNLAMLRYCQAQALVTKESGEAGGNQAKLAAAEELAIPVIMIRRPELEYGWTVDSVEQVLRAVKEKLN